MPQCALNIFETKLKMVELSPTEIVLFIAIGIAFLALVFLEFLPNCFYNLQQSDYQNIVDE
jgi:hypothetical protein